jgi:hypothetical protein
MGRRNISKATVDRCSRTVNSNAPEICFRSSFDCFIANLESETVEAGHVGGLDCENYPLVNQAALHCQNLLSFGNRESAICGSRTSRGVPKTRRPALHQIICCGARNGAQLQRVVGHGKEAPRFQCCVPTFPSSTKPEGSRGGVNPSVALQRRHGIPGAPQPQPKPTG